MEGGSRISSFTSPGRVFLVAVGPEEEYGHIVSVCLEGCYSGWAVDKVWGRGADSRSGPIVTEFGLFLWGLGPYALAISF